LQFTSARDLESFKTSSNAPDILRKSIDQVLGVTVKFKPLIAESAEVKTEALPVVSPAPEMDEVVEVEEAAEAPVEKIVEKKPAAKSRNSKMVNEEERYGESLLREMLGAEPVEDKKNR
jgi:DNA polymerase-3 subunit gamma/tau